MIIVIIKKTFSLISMTTTIQVSEETQKKLFQIINALEDLKGKRVTYNEAIEYLLQEHERKFDKEQFLNTMKKFQGIFKQGEATKLLNESRQLDREREKRIFGS